MRKLVLCLAAVCVMAAPAFAQGGRLNPPGSPGGQNLNDPGYQGHGKQQPPDYDNDQPTRPVPEPGTMALASMGLIALGAAARKRHSS